MFSHIKPQASVCVAMSGGVDSAGAALLLQQAGLQVSGVTLLLHNCKSVPDQPGESTETLSARAVAETIHIPHTVLDRRDIFQKEVMNHFVAEYVAGHTPNPCVDCNREIKFGVLLDWALAQGADYLATGHYAKVARDPESGRWLLLRGDDRSKDQSYVLYQLTQFQLSHLILPVGTYEKPVLRKLAEEAGLPNAQRHDSQDICFIPDGDYVGFLKECGVQPQPGSFVDEAGQVLGTHKGLECYTTGQRKGLGISANVPVYVLRKNGADNTIVVGPNEHLFRRELEADRVNWISIPSLTSPIRVTAKTRYSQREAAATVEPLENGHIRVVFDEPQRAITAGQAVVLYDGEKVVGGGTILD